MFLKASRVPLNRFSRHMSTKPLATVSMVDEKLGIAALTFNNAPVNALTKEFNDAVCREVNHLDKAVKGLIVRSGLPNKSFSAGLNLDQLLIPEGTLAKDREAEFIAFFSSFVNLIRSFLSCNVPTVAVIEGAAPAGGTVMAMACDYRIATTGKLIMGVTEHRLGLPPPHFVLKLGEQVLGTRKAMRYFQLGKIIGPDEALMSGFVDELVDEDPMTVAVARLKDYVTLPSLSALHTTKLLQNDPVLSMIKDSRVPSEELWSAVQTTEFQSVLKAYLASLKKPKK